MLATEGTARPFHRVEWHRYGATSSVGTSGSPGLRGSAGGSLGPHRHHRLNGGGAARRGNAREDRDQERRGRGD